MPVRNHSRGYLTGEGYLTIERKGKEKTQTCMYSVMACGHWCPLFGEPRPASSVQTSIDICRDTTLVFFEFEDRRP